MEVDRHGLEILARDESLRLLGHATVGRVVVSDQDGAAVFPVNFGLLGDDVVFLSAAGTKLAAALREAAVTFEADEIDRGLEAGWSVLVRGHAAIISRADELEAARALSLRPWVRVDRTIFVRIRSESVSGRRLPGRVGNDTGAADGAELGPADPAPKDGLLATLADPAFARRPLVKKLCDVVEVAQASIGECHAASVSLFGTGESNPEVCTSEVAHRLDRAQYHSGAGPGAVALASSQVVTVEDIDAAPGWDEFRRAAAGAGIRSSLSVPLTRAGLTVGMLNLYSGRPGGFRGCEAAAAELAVVVGAAIWGASGARISAGGAAR